MNVPDLSSPEKVAAYVEAHTFLVDKARAHALARGRAPSDIVVIFFVSDEADRPSQIVAGHLAAAVSMLEQLAATGRCPPEVATELISDLRTPFPPSLARVLVCGCETTSVVDVIVETSPPPFADLSRTAYAMRASLGWLLLQNAASPEYAKRSASLARWQERAAAAILAESHRSSPRDDLTVLWTSFGSPRLAALFEAGKSEEALDLLLSGAEATPS